METPLGWAWAKIGDMISRDGVFCDGDWVESQDQDPDGDVRLIQLADIGDGVYNDRSSRFLTRSRAEELKCTFLKKGDLLISRMPDPLGRSCVFPGDRKPAVTVVDACIVRTASDVSHGWLMHAVNSPQSRQKIAALQTGSTRKRISRKNLATIEYPVPPVVEQRAIVAKIEQLFSELEKGVEQLQTVKQQLKQYRQAVLKAAFEGKLTAEWRAEQQAAGDLPGADELLEQIEKEREKRYQQQLREWKQALAQWEAAGGGESGQKKPAEPIRPRATSAVSSMEPSDLGVLPKGWAWLRLSSVGDISGGITKNPKRARLPHRFPYLRVANVYANRLDLQEVDEIGVTGTEYQRAILAANDVLFVEGNGSVDQIGRVAVWNGCISPCLHQNHLIKCRPILPEMARFILYWFLSPVGRSVIVREASSTSGLYTLSISKVSSLAIPVTSMAEQQQVLREIDSRFSVLDQLEKAVDHGLQQAEGLRQSILKKAFEGRLLSEAELAAVRNDPEYEPADKLLERIRAEREKDKQSMRSSRAGSTCRETRRGSSRPRQEETNETASEAR